ncbi:MAG: hypothetical protein K6A43_05395 [Treponema sp.]|nr:hypothetical protein [Treponema sp.]
MKNIYINSQGGLGFNLALSHITKELKQVYGKVCILSPYFDVFESCPYVDYVYKPNEIRDFIFDAKHDDAKLICERMYDSEDFIYKKVSYADAWRKAAGIQTKGNKDGSDTRAELYPLKKYPDMINSVEGILSTIKEQGKQDFVIMQFEGGQSPLVEVPVAPDGKPDWSKVPVNYDNEPLKRHYPFEKAQDFIDKFTELHPETAVVIYQLPNEHQFKGTLSFQVPYLVYYELAKNKLCRGTVSIDSSLQHMVAGICKSVVIWGHSLPLSFGYEYNRNLVQSCNRDDILYFSALGPSGARVDYIQPDELLKEVDNYLYPDARKAA